MFVRIGHDNQQDEDAFEALSRMAVEESASDLGYDPERVRETYRQSVAGAHPTIFLVDHKCEVIGFLIATMSSYRFTDGLYTTQEVLFVRPDMRGTRAAVLLLDELVRWSDLLGAKEITGGNDNNLLSERTARLLEKRGFERVGIFMRRKGRLDGR